jgi:hypothetical protein
VVAREAWQLHQVNGMDAANKKLPRYKCAEISSLASMFG